MPSVLPRKLPQDLKAPRKLNHVEDIKGMGEREVGKESCGKELTIEERTREDRKNRNIPYKGCRERPTTP